MSTAVVKDASAPKIEDATPANVSPVVPLTKDETDIW